MKGQEQDESHSSEFFGRLRLLPPSLFLCLAHLHVAPFHLPWWPAVSDRWQPNPSSSPCVTITQALVIIIKWWFLINLGIADTVFVLVFVLSMADGWYSISVHDSALYAILPIANNSGFCLKGHSRTTNLCYRIWTGPVTAVPFRRTRRTRHGGFAILYLFRAAEGTWTYSTVSIDILVTTSRDTRSVRLSKGFGPLRETRSRDSEFQ